MSAIRQPATHQSSTSTVSTRSVAIERRKAARTRSQQSARRTKHLVLATETLMKLLVNGALSAATVLTLMSLFPYYWTQQAKLQEVREEVRVTEAEVEELQTQFNRSFDPSQAHSVMREQTGLLGPNQRRIVLTNQKPE